MQTHSIISSKEDFDLLFGIVGSTVVLQCLRTAIELSLPDQLATGPKQIAELATLSESDNQALYRVMRLLAEYGIFREIEPGLFDQTSVSHLLRKNIKNSVRDFVNVNMLGGFQLATLQHLSDNVRRGEPAFSLAHNGMSLWQYLTEVDPAAGQEFTAAVSSLSTIYDHDIASSLECKNCRLIADIGGGDGKLLCTLLKINPALSGILFDQPEVIENIQERALGTAVADRCHLQKGDFLEHVPTDVNAYIMRHILHDWNDENCIKILKNCRRASPNAKIFIIERIIQAGNNDPYTLVLDLWMMMLFKDAKERTKQEYTALLETSGYKVNRIIVTPSPFSIIEGIPM